jgi:hypothetical protein
MAFSSKKAACDWLALWILLSAWSCLSGWFLSACGYLVPAGIAVSFVLFLGSLALFRSWLVRAGSRHGWKMVRSRFLVPKIWLALAILELIGGLAYAPNNYDFMSYRFTRVLYWTWQHGWFWVPTVDHRVNYSGTGFEWLMIPIFVVFKTDRLFFLINFIPYLLLPGLIFSVFSGLGISKRISWWWMWVFPCGYCYILQAASAGNDSFAVVYFLASIHYLLQAKSSSSIKNLVLSCLAVALMTSAKASNLPLVLPWLVVLFFHQKEYLEKCSFALLAGVLVVAATVSFLPMALLNIHYTGDYAGDPNNSTLMKVRNPLLGVVGNSLQLAKDNLMLPVWPRPIDWANMIPSGLKADIVAGFPRLDIHSGELQVEEQAGLGLGSVLFAGLFLLRGLYARTVDSKLIAPRNNLALWVVGSGALAWMVYMSKMGSEATSRLIAAYYPLLVAGVLVVSSLDGQIVRRRIFKWVGALAMLSAGPLVILSPARPLFPVQVVSSLMLKSHVSPEIIDRYDQVYSVYATRSDAFGEILALIPPGEQTIGLLQAGDEQVAALWRPFGTRNILEVTPADSRNELKAHRIHFVVISQDALTFRYHTDLAVLLAKWSGSTVAEKRITLLVRAGPQTWYLVAM